GRVNSAIRKSHIACNGGNIQNMSKTLFAHLWQNGLYNINRAVKIGLEGIFYFTLGGFLYWARNTDARIVYYYIDFFYFAKYFSDNSFNGLDLVHVHFQKRKDSICYLFRISTGSEDLIAFFSKVFAYGFTNSRGTACNEYCFWHK